MIHRSLACFFACIALSAHAVEYNTLQPDKSSVSFIYKQMNAPTEGRFKRFTGQIRFDPQKPAASSARLDIDIESIDTGSLDADSEVRGKPWFNTSAFPRASYVTTSITPAGAGRYDVRGKLTIKGRTMDVACPVTFREQGGAAVFEGVLTIRRADFAIGEGIWADFGTVANEVQIKFNLLATAAPAKK